MVTKCFIWIFIINGAVRVGNTTLSYQFKECPMRQLGCTTVAWTKSPKPDRYCGILTAGRKRSPAPTDSELYYSGLFSSDRVTVMTGWFEISRRHKTRKR
ncbi:hypothetical protein PGT21_035965 [Puccinia graminis f. sp. tritici]|uniref:Secreted protein n=1 Tax=Puccinia graminis f. sp. tritici TaxID=56615 RepID=A0A5B0PN41_PUCGR|nr:hypothetical protein PGT21_035965 [Puccinia graminis f. sp. tritici]